jgi:Mismatch repair ATPase (MutS family)
LPSALGYDSYAFLPEQAPSPYANILKSNRSTASVAPKCRRRSPLRAQSFITLSTSFGEISIMHGAALRCAQRSRAARCCYQTNLELVESRNSRDTSLLAVLDRTITPMGARKLRAWILQPLRNLMELERRQQMIANLLQEADLLASLRASLKLIRDIERAAGRLSQASGNARDLVALKISLEQIPKLKSELQRLLDRLAFGATRINENGNVELLAQGLQSDLREMPELTDKLTRAVVDDPPLALKEGGIFRDGYDVDLDALRRASREGKDWISQLQEREIAATGSNPSRSATTRSSAISSR